MSIVTETKKQSKISNRLAVLLDELDHECAHVRSLIAKFRIANLETEQLEDILAELHAAIIHLNTHTDGLDTLISKEMDEL